MSASHHHPNLPPRPANVDTSNTYSHTNGNSYQRRTSDTRPNGGSSSPVRPEYSPITPKVQPAFPVINTQQPAFVPPPENGGNFTFSPADIKPPQQNEDEAQPRRQPAQDQPMRGGPANEYIPPPPNLPFTGEDATDAIALKAAISTLQFQKKKAQDDIKTLASLKQLALNEPESFAQDLAKGKIGEQRPKIGDMQAILDQAEEGDSDEEVDFSALARDKGKKSLSPEIPDSQPGSQSQKAAGAQQTDGTPSFPRIPGPQTVVRMPHVNWDKYGVVGEPLERLHNQQQKWPGTTAAYGQERGREYTIAAPYSPFLDHIDTQHVRKDSGAMPSATGTISEHPMSTRSRD